MKSLQPISDPLTIVKGSNVTGLAMSERKTTLKEDDAARVEADFRAELEAEHQSRQDEQVRREERSKEKMAARERERQILAEEELKEKVRADFYKEKGYKLYTDSAGREHWLTPEEFDWRMRIRARHDRNRRRFEPSRLAQKRRLLMYAGAAILAILTGLVLLK